MNAQDLDRIRFVTRHFHDLQGLQRVGTGLAMLAGAIGFAIGGPLGLAPIVVGGAAGIWLSWRARSYYTRQFGQVERRKMNPLSPRGQRVLLLVLFVFLPSYLAMASYFQQLMPSPVATARFLCLGCGALSIRVWWRQGSRLCQAHYLVFGFLCLGLAAPVDALRPIQLILSRREGVWLLLGAFHLVTGLFDHLVLVRTMTRLSAVHGALAAAARVEAPR
jgi:hypothetical protein